MNRHAPLALMLTISCSAVNHTYIRGGYDALAPTALKRIAIVSWAHPERFLGANAQEELSTFSEMMTEVANDRVALKMNYLVYHRAPLKRGWPEACLPRSPNKERGTHNVEGVLVLRLLKFHLSDDNSDVELQVAGHLYRCSDGELLWHAEATDTYDIKDENLKAMAASYQKLFKGLSGKLAPAVFQVVRDILNTLPDPALNDDDIMEKIELG